MRRVSGKPPALAINKSIQGRIAFVGSLPPLCVPFATPPGLAGRGLTRKNKGTVMRAIRRIIIHSSATAPSATIGAQEIRGWHVNDNGWSDIGYHFVIRRCGTPEPGRPVRLSGAHVANHNSDSIGICMVGGVKQGSRTPENNFTDKQWDRLAVLVSDLCGDFTNLTIHGHKEFAATACPSFEVAEWLKANIEPVPDHFGLHYDPAEPYSPDDYLETSSLLSSFFVWLRSLFSKGGA